MATTSKSAKSSKSTAAKKPAAKKPAAKKPTAKKTAAKKPAVKKATVKKAAPAKKPAAKKPAAKKPAAKKAAVPAKKPATKKTAPAKKPAAKKPAVKKPAAKKAVPAKKPVVKKVAVVKPKPAAKPATAPAPVRPAVKPPFAPALGHTVDTGAKGLNIFEAFSQDKIPRSHGYIISSFFKEGSVYSIYEITAYSGAKEITAVGNSLQFTAKSKKLYILIEPSAYNEKHVDPVHRKEGESIPYRENELEIVRAIDQTRIMVSKEPKEGPGSFTVVKPAGNNSSVVFNAVPDIHQKIAAFFKHSLNLERRIPLWDADKAAQLISKTVEKTLSWQGEAI